jgi:transposase-like protein
MVYGLLCLVALTNLDKAFCNVNPAPAFHRCVVHPACQSQLLYR